MTSADLHRFKKQRYNRSLLGTGCFFVSERWTYLPAQSDNILRCSIMYIMESYGILWNSMEHDRKIMEDQMEAYG